MQNSNRPPVSSRLRWSVALAGLATVLAGCGFGGSGTAPEPEASPGGTTGEQTLTFWIHGADPFVEAHNKIVAGFEAENPGVKVNIESFPFAEFNTRVVASLPNRQGPDVLEAYSPWMTTYIRAGLLAQVPETIGSAQQIQERYFESPLSLLSLEGDYFGLPSNLAAGSTRVLLVNDQIVKEAGVSLEDNDAFEDWVADWQALTVTDANGRITRAGLGQSCGQPADQFVTYLLQYDGSLLSEDGHTATFNDAAGLKALTLLGDLNREYRVDSTDITDATCIPQGTAATGYRGTWVIPEYTRDFPDFDWSYHLMPLPPGASNESWQGGSGWATYVPAASPNTELAWKFVDYLEANRKTWIETTGEIPADRALAAEVAAANPDLYGVYYPILEDSVHGYPYGDYFVVYQTLSDMVASVTLQGTDPQAALATAESAINAHLEQWWSQ